MSQKNRRKAIASGRGRALVFAALGDDTRLLLIAKLCSGQPHSISELTEGSKLTRQAITKHLRVFEGAGLVAHLRAFVPNCKGLGTFPPSRAFV